MINIKNAQTIDGKTQNLTIPSSQHIEIDASHLTLLPGLIDPHVHFRTPGHEYKEDWRTAALASIRGGYTTVFDMPNNLPPCVTKQRFDDKQQLIQQQLQEIGIPLRFYLYLGADKYHFDQIHQVKQQIIGIKVFMGSSTGDLMMDDDSSLHAIFALAAAHDLVVAVHAEDECMIQERTQLFKNQKEYKTHSLIRNPEVAAAAVTKAIGLSKMYGTRLYILHVSTQQELQLIQAAKTDGLSVYAETTPHHLFLNDSAYEQWAGQAQMNPPLRSHEHQPALFAAIHQGTIDTIGSDHAPHTVEEKRQPYGLCPSGVPGIETTLPLLLNAHHQGLISLKEIVSLTHHRARTIFRLPPTDDVVLVDLNKTAQVETPQLKTKCGWSPFAGMTLTGWPVYTIIDGMVYDSVSGKKFT